MNTVHPSVLQLCAVVIADNRDADFKTFLAETGYYIKKGFVKLLLANKSFVSLFRRYDSEKLGCISRIIELGQLNDSDLDELLDIVKRNDSFDFLISHTDDP